MDQKWPSTFMAALQFWPSLFAAAAAARVAHDKREPALCMPNKRGRLSLCYESSGAKGGRRSKHDGGEVPLDKDDPSDQAFDLVVNHGFKINDA